MGDVKNLEYAEALKKVKHLAEEIKMCMLCTNLGHAPFETRPMATQEVDEHGNIWFLSSMESHKNEEILADSRVQLIYAENGKYHFMTVYGEATVVKDREKTAELFDVFAKAWFQKGKDDPSLTLIRVRPDQAYYWDTKHGKMVSLLKIAVAAITGKKMDDGGIEGNIDMPNG